MPAGDGVGEGGAGRGAGKRGGTGEGAGKREGAGEGAGVEGLRDTRDGEVRGGGGDAAS